VPHRILFLAAGLAWTLAAAMLLGRAGLWLLKSGDHLILRYAIALTGGIAFYFLLFSKISRRHIARIQGIDELRPCLLSFFGFRSYIMMVSMIAGGILLRTFKLVEPSILYTFYTCMGTPLLISAFLFYRSFATYRRS
jgi:hypothetical protein